MARNHKHYCPDWDFLLIGLGDPEMACCTCVDGLERRQATSTYDRMSAACIDEHPSLWATWGNEAEPTYEASWKTYAHHPQVEKRKRKGGTPLAVIS
jgi:hypothetical protein